MEFMYLEELRQMILGMPDIGLTTLHDVSTQSHQIARVTNLPTIIDIDTGFGEAMNVSRTIETIESH